jgi:nucleoside-diphosphate kinase
MATNRTFTMIKPDAVANGHIGNILAMITNAGFKIISLKLTQLTVADAQAFYACCKTFLRRISRIYVKRRYCCCYFRKDNAVEDFRTLIGATNPADAEGTIRKAYATSIGENAVHGSDSDENAAIEGAFHLQEESSSEHSTFLVFS